MENPFIKALAVVSHSFILEGATEWKEHRIETSTELAMTLMNIQNVNSPIQTK